MKIKRYLIASILAHLLMPIVVTCLAAGLIEYWSEYLFDIHPLKLGANGNSYARIFWTVFVLTHIKFGIDWWFDFSS